MDRMNSRGECSGIGKRYCCENNVACGTQTQVVYVPVPVITTMRCKTCQMTCHNCQKTSKQLPSTGVINSENADARKCPHCNTDDVTASDRNGKHETGYSYAHAEGKIGASRQFRECISNQHDNYYKLCMCDGNPHFTRVSLQQAVFECEANASFTHASEQDKHLQFCQCQKPSDNYMLHSPNFTVKSGSCENGNHNCTHRRCSEDSGRVTWSDSGDSILSDSQASDHRRRHSTTTQPHPSTNQTRKISTSSYKIDNGNQLLDHPAPHKSDYFLYSEDGVKSSGQNSELWHAQHNDMISSRQRKKSYTVNDRSIAVSITPAWASEVHNTRRVSQKDDSDYHVDAVEARHPRRSSSDWMLKRLERTTTKPRRERLDSLQEQDITLTTNPPRRPRSKSLFAGAGRRKLLSSPTKQYWDHNQQNSPLDFTKWGALQKSWNIGNEGPGEQCIKAYGIVAVPSMHGIAFTDADKVKIKIYGTNGEEKVTFGTPTWPHYGRGITRNKTGNQLVVCHLSEICTYDLDGKLIKRYPHVNATGAFWGVACDNDGNHVVTDPKSSSVFIMTTQGNVVRQIGGETISSWNRPKNQAKRSRRGKKGHSEEKQHLSADEISNDVRSGWAISVKSPVTKANSSPGSTLEKKQARLVAPRFVAVNSKNQILVTDTKQRCLVVMENDGTPLFTIGGGRSGCKRCRPATDERRKTIIKDIVSATDFCIGIPMQSPSGNPLMPSNTEDAAPSQEHEDEKLEGATNYLADLCGPRTKSVRPKVLGSISRAQLGREESAESQAYQPTAQKVVSTMENSVEEVWRRQSCRIACRLSTHTREMSVECHSCNDLLDRKEEKDQNNSKQKMKVLRKSMRGIWKGKDRNKRAPARPPTGKCESLTSISCDTSTGTGNQGDDKPITTYRSNSPDSPTTEREKHANSAMSPSSEESLRYHSAPVSPRDGPDYSNLTSPATQDLAYAYDRRRSDDFYSPVVEQEPHLEQDDDTIACRKCHVEDPRGICVDNNDNILLVDRTRHRVTIFDQAGHFVRHLLTEEDGLREPKAVCIIEPSTIAVTDSSSCVKLFQFLAGD